MLIRKLFRKDVNVFVVRLDLGGMMFFRCCKKISVGGNSRFMLKIFGLISDLYVLLFCFLLYLVFKFFFVVVVFDCGIINVDFLLFFLELEVKLGIVF